MAADFWTTGNKASVHLQTLYWMGGGIFDFVLRWRGKSIPEVGERFKTEFGQLHLQEQWIVEVSDKDTGGIRICTARSRAIDDLSTFDERVQANQGLYSNKEAGARTQADVDQIMVWLRQFIEEPKVIGT